MPPIFAACVAGFKALLHGANTPYQELHVREGEQGQLHRMFYVLVTADALGYLLMTNFQLFLGHCPQNKLTRRGTNLKIAKTSCKKSAATTPTPALASMK